MLKSDYEISLEGREYPGYYMRLNQRGGVQDYYLYGNRLNFTDLQSYKNWFERVKGYTQNVRNSLEINKEGLELGYTQPKLVTRGVSTQIGAMLEKDLENHSSGRFRVRFHFLFFHACFYSTSSSHFCILT